MKSIPMLSMCLNFKKVKAYRKHAIAVMLLSTAFEAHSFAYELQAAIINTAVNSSKLIKVESLKSKMTYLFNSLDPNEGLMLAQHPELKISSYMHVMTLWEEKSLRELLVMRGVNADKLYYYIKDHGGRAELLDVPLFEFGSAAIPLHDACKSTSNELTEFNVLELNEFLNQYVNVYFSELGESYAAEAMLFFINASTLIKIHDPMMTHAQTTSKCVSDLEGSLTCSDGLYDVDGISENVLKHKFGQIENAVIRDLAMANNFGQRKIIDLLSSCYVPMRYLMKTAGLINPLTDKYTIQFSELLYTKSQVELNKTGNSISLESEILPRNRYIMDVTYNFPEYAKNNKLEGSKEELKQLRNKYIQQNLVRNVELATINVKELLNNTTLL